MSLSRRDVFWLQLVGSKKETSLLNWNSGFSFKPPAANLMAYPGIQVFEMPISFIRCLDLKARVRGPREPRELELGLTQPHMTQKLMLRVKWMRVRCACKSGPRWVGGSVKRRK